MNQYFTGNSRKTRQVNLSGRGNANPWANTPGTPKATTGSSNNTIIQIQAERLKRQQERDRLLAVKKIQRTWRGHSARERQKDIWRREWDRREQSCLRDVETQDGRRGRSEDEVISQLKSLLLFFNTKLEADRRRLIQIGNALYQIESHRVSPNHTSRLLRRLSQATGESIGYEEGQQLDQLLRLGSLLAPYVPKSDSNLHFHNLVKALRNGHDGDTVTKYVTSLLATSEEAAYVALAKEFLQSPEASRLTDLMTFLEDNQNLLYQALLNSPDIFEQDPMSLTWILAYLVYIPGLATKTQARSTSQKWLEAVSTLLGLCANVVSEKIDTIDEPMAGSEHDTNAVHSFVREQVSTLAQQQSIQLIMQQLDSTNAQAIRDTSAVAKSLANYAVALLRSFPTKATNIRMYLYRNSPSGNVDGLSTIQYLWKASQGTRVFKRILADQRNVMSALTEAAPPSNQTGQQPVSSDEVASWKEDWRIVLLFLELYTFILKLMDDEEFFALSGSSASQASKSGPFLQFRQGALPLHDVSRLGMFLKHLAFSLYWNAAELVDADEHEEENSLAALFGRNVAPVPETAEKRVARKLAGNDVSQAYLKGLSTGLLRMLYERDSRRKFLPNNYWLMTSQFDLHGFIPAVAEEEERRHELGDDDDDDDDVHESAHLDDGEFPDALDESANLPTVGTLFNIRGPHVPRSQSSRMAEQMAKQRMKARKRRQLQSLAPRLEVLRNLPFFIPFETRVQIFRQFIYRDQLRRRNGYVEADDWRMSLASTQGRDLDGRPRGLDVIGRHHANIRRQHIFEDAFGQFYELGEGLKEPIQISFIDQFGSTEAGIDGGGVTKEFLISVTNEVLKPASEASLFEENEQRYLYPRPEIAERARELLRRRGATPGQPEYADFFRSMLQQFEFVGRVVGKCLYEGILIDVTFAGFFLLKWALTGGTTTASNETAYRASINDLRDYDEGLYQGLLKLKNYTGDVEGDFGLNFTVTDQFTVDDSPKNTTKDLIRNGWNTPVTNANRLLYIDKITRYRLQEQPQLVTNAFLKGLGQIISPMWLAMFNQVELQKLVGGDNSELDIADLRQNTQYGGLYVIGDDGLEHPTVALFWKVLNRMDDQDRRKVLKFVTSTPRAPLLGFGHLNPKFSIRDSSHDQTRLPSTSTCVNLLKLPRYSDEKTMREKLLYAVNAGAGFDLS